MARLAAALPATALATFRWLQARPVTGGRFRGVARAAADPLPQLGQLTGQGGELTAQQFLLKSRALDLLLLPLKLIKNLKEASLHSRRGCGPVRF